MLGMHMHVCQSPVAPTRVSSSDRSTIAARRRLSRPCEATLRLPPDGDELRNDRATTKVSALRPRASNEMIGDVGAPTRNPVGREQRLARTEGKETLGTSEG